MHANSAILDFIQRRPRSDNEFPSSILPRLSGAFFFSKDSYFNADYVYNSGVFR